MELVQKYDLQGYLFHIDKVYRDQVVCVNVFIYEVRNTVPIKIFPWKWHQIFDANQPAIND